MPREARRHCISSTTGWRRSTDHGRVLHCFPEELVAVIEATLVDESPKQLNWRLSAILLDGRHIDVIHEDRDSLAWVSSEDSALLLLQLVLDRALHSVR